MMTKNRLDVALQLKNVQDSGEFEGYGSVFNIKDSAGDIVQAGAFQKSLEQWRAKNQYPAMLWQHDTREPIGVYTEIKEDAHGLYVKGRLLIDDDPLARRAHAHLKAGSISGLSIGYLLNDFEYDKGKDGWILKEIDLWEVSLVTFPANDEARIAEVKQLLAKGQNPPPSKVERALRDVGFSSKQAKAFIASGYKAACPRDADKGLAAMKALIQSIGNAQ